MRPEATGAGETAAPTRGQFALLGERRFGPFFWTQLSGAANDNLFKFAFTVLATYELQTAWLPPASAGLVIGALFILPFVLFSATGGQLADRFDKAALMRAVKWAEIGIMAVAAVGLARRDAALLLACVFGMGLHSTLFGPAKFAYLPQHLSERELIGGNALVESGTFVAILLGSVLGGLLVAVPQAGPVLVGAACVGLAAVGRLVAGGIPPSPPADRAAPLRWNPFAETWRTLERVRQTPAVFRSLLAISWMWFFGAVFLANFPAFAKDVLHGDEQVASLLLVVFSAGIGSGSLACERLSRRHVEIGIVPLGAIGMGAFAIDLFFATRALADSAPLSALAFLAVPAHWRVIADLALLAFSAGLYSVPIYAFVQWRSPPSHRARVIAANNVLNALFMIASAALAGALLAAGVSIPGLFLIVGLLDLLVAGAIFALVPEYALRCAAFVLARLRRLQIAGDAWIPPRGAAILVVADSCCGAADALLLIAASPRWMRFAPGAGPHPSTMLGRLFRIAEATAEPGSRAAGALAAEELVVVRSAAATWLPAFGGAPMLTVSIGNAPRFGRSTLTIRPTDRPTTRPASSAAEVAP